LLNGADCGVPQRRERVFFVAIRNDIQVKPLKLAPKHQWINCENATKDLKIKAMLYFSPQSGPSSTTSSLTLYSICLQTSCTIRHSLKGFPRH
jgi:site-specific DNA-cytosine methylase